MKYLWKLAAAAPDITDVAEVKEEISKTAQWVQDMLPKLIDFIIQVALAFIVIAVGVKIIGWIRKLLRKTLERREAEAGLIQFLDSLVKIMLYLMLALSVMQKFGIQTASVVAAIGSVGVAIGLALQGSLSNFAGGVIILLIKPFRVGDYIVQGALEGTVTEIELFYTSLLTPDNRRVVVPNGNLANNSLTNVTAEPVRRVDISVGISYESDMKLAKDVLLKTAAADADVLTENPPMAAVESLGDSAVNLFLRVWVPTEKYWDAKFRLTENVKNAFDEAGIEIPFNRMDVHVKTSN